MSDKSDLTVCVVDHGLFLPVALRLAREAGRVYYTTESQKPFPSVSDIIGDGFEGVHYVPSLWDVHDRVNLFVFPDVGFASLQRHLIEDGHPVWGARTGDSLETMRGKFLKVLDEVGLMVPPHEEVRGFSRLREILRDVEDRYIKVSGWRGDWETLHWRSWELDELELEARGLKLGPWKEEIKFYVFEPIDATIEDGLDSYCIDGQWPKVCLHGMEAKDRALIATFQKFSEVPEEMRHVSEAIGPVLAEHGYRSFFSTEVRITEAGESYFIDPTCRAGSPPHQLQSEMIANYLDVIARGAQGEVVDPVPSSKFGAQAVLDIPGDDCDWRILTVPPELEQWIKPSMCSRIGNRLVFPPHTHKEVCWLTATGDTIKDTLGRLQEYSELLPDGVTCEFHALRELIEEIHEAEEKGMTFTDQPVPQPEEIES